MKKKTDTVEYVHGLADYGMGVLLMISPWLFRFSDNTVATQTTIAFGWLTLLYSAVTDYELGLTGKLPFRLHLALDGVSAGLLIAAPFLFAFSDHVWVPHLVMGIVVASVTAITLLAIVFRGAAGNSDHRTV